MSRTVALLTLSGIAALLWLLGSVLRWMWINKHAGRKDYR